MMELLRHTINKIVNIKTGFFPNSASTLIYFLCTNTDLCLLTLSKCGKQGSKGTKRKATPAAFSRIAFFVLTSQAQQLKKKLFRISGISLKGAKYT